MVVSRIFLSLLTLVLLVACARPKYKIEESAPSTLSNTAESTALGEYKTECPNIFSQSRLCMKWAWENQPTAKTPGTFIFKVYRLNQWDQTAIEVDLEIVPEVVLWMPGMGHGSTPTQVERLDVGTYRARQVFFVMPGDWEIKFQVKDNKNGVVDGVTIATSI